MRTHGGLTERSRTHSLTAPIGKGREGKGRGRGSDLVALATPLQTAPRGFADACNGWHHGEEQCCEWSNRPAFALDADLTVYWPAVRPCWEER